MCCREAFRWIRLLFVLLLVQLFSWIRVFFVRLFRWLLVRLIWEFLIFDKAQGLHDRFWAICHKMFLILACERFLANKTKDVVEDLGQNHIWGLSVRHSRVLVMFVCLVIYIIILCVVYLLFKWKRFSAAKGRWYERSYRIIFAQCLASTVRSFVLPVFWPFLCAYVGSLVHRFSSLLVFAYIECAILAFMFRHRQGDDFGMIDTLTAIQVSLFVLCNGDHCKTVVYGYIYGSSSSRFEEDDSSCFETCMGGEFSCVIAFFGKTDIGFFWTFPCRPTYCLVQ